MFKRILLCVVTLVVAASMAWAAGQTITFDGTNTGVLQSSPVWQGPAAVSSLFTTLSFADNNITFADTTATAQVGNFFGGLSNQTGETVTNNTATLTAGMVSVDLVGGRKGGNTGITGDATLNKVIVSGGSVVGVIYGANSTNNGSAYSNDVLLSGTNAITAARQVYGAYCFNNGEAFYNSVTVDNSNATVSNTVFGAYTSTDQGTRYNTVTLKSGKVNGLTGAYGGGSGNAEYNSAVMTGGQVNGSVYGANSTTGGSVRWNGAHISGGSVSANVFGGNSSNAGVVNNNSVDITGSATVISGTVYGAQSSNFGDTSSNAIRISAATISGDISGAYNRSDGNSDYNNVVLQNHAWAKSNVYGTYNFDTGISNYNVVVIDASSVDQGVYGVYSATTGDANYNQVQILSGSKIGMSVFGASNATGGSAKSNDVVVDTSSVVGNVYGARNVANGDTSYNTLTVTGSDIKSNVYGALNETAGFAEYNATLVRNSNIGGIVNGSPEGMAYGATNKSAGEANYNRITLENCTVSRDVFGAHNIAGGKLRSNDVFIRGGVYKGKIYGARNEGGTVSNETEYNSVSIFSGSVSGDIYGGNASFGDVTYNTVNLYDACDVQLASLWGGFSSGGADVSTGNTLNLIRFIGQAKSVANFEFYRFTLPGTLTPATPMLTLTGAGGSASSVANSTMGLTPMAVAPPLQFNTPYPLMVLPTGTDTSSVTLDSTSQLGNYTYRLEWDSTTLNLIILSGNPGGGGGGGSQPGTPSKPVPSDISITLANESFVAQKQPDGTYLLQLPFGTPTDAVQISMKLPSGATVSPSLNATFDFSSGKAQRFVITAADGVTRYEVLLRVVAETSSTWIERGLVTEKFEECALVITPNANGTARVDILMPFLPGVVPTERTDLIATFKNSGDVAIHDIEFAHVDSNGNVVPYLLSEQSPALVKTPYLQISGTVARADFLKNEELISIKYRVTGDAAQYIQKFPNGGVRLYDMKVVISEDPNRSGGGSSSGCSAVALPGVSLLLLLGVALIQKKK